MLNRPGNRFCHLMVLKISSGVQSVAYKSAALVFIKRNVLLSVVLVRLSLTFNLRVLVIIAAYAQ